MERNPLEKQGMKRETTQRILLLELIEEDIEYTLTIRVSASEGFDTFQYPHIIRVTSPSASSPWETTTYQNSGFYATITDMSL